MQTFFQILLVTADILMIIVVLVQGGNQGGIGAALGGGNTQGVFGASGATSLLGKITYGVAITIMASSLALVILEGKNSKVGLEEKLKSRAQQGKTLDMGTSAPVPVD